MPGSVARIAFVSEWSNAFARQLTSGISHFAKPDNGCVLREFLVGESNTELPAALEAWRPDAIVSYIQASRADLLNALSAQGRPLVSTSRMEPGPNRAVVLGDAEELYRLVHSHFHEIGVAEVVQFALGESPLGRYSTRERYRRFAESQGMQCRSFAVEEPAEPCELLRPTRPDPELVEWLKSFQRPTGIFTQHNLAGSYLCSTCHLVGISVPQEIAVIGSDGFDVALASSPPLTTIHVPGEAIGYRASQLAVAMLEGKPAPAEIVTIAGARLLVRGSTNTRVGVDCNVDRAMDFIFNHACDGIRVNDVISHTQGVSRMTFHKRFSQAFGMTPGDAIKERQLSEARRLVAETELSFAAIAMMCGFCDYTHFYRAFSEVEGVGPRDYRRVMFAG